MPTLTGQPAVPFDVSQKVLDGRDKDSNVVLTEEAKLHLVRHESDFNLAIVLQLLPPETTWNEFGRYIDAMRAIPDEQCSLRYTYGEIRLTRLNFYAPILLRRRYYHRPEYHYSGYFATFYGPRLFVIGFSTVILTALQLAVQVDIEAATVTGSSSSVQGGSAAVSSSTASDNSAVISLKSFCRFVGYSSVVITSVVAFYLSMLLVVKFCKEWHFTIGERVGQSEEAMQERDRLHTKNSMV